MVKTRAITAFVLVGTILMSVPAFALQYGDLKSKNEMMLYVDTTAAGTGTSDVFTDVSGVSGQSGPVGTVVSSGKYDSNVELSTSGKAKVKPMQQIDVTAQAAMVKETPASNLPAAAPQVKQTVTKQDISKMKAELANQQVQANDAAAASQQEAAKLAVYQASLAEKEAAAKVAYIQQQDQAILQQAVAELEQARTALNEAVRAAKAAGVM